MAGCAVTYHGIEKGLEDLGRDVIAEKDGEVEVIQCKYWSRHREIHEETLRDGRCLGLDNPGKVVHGTFVTSTRLSRRAQQFAKQLNARVEENYPFESGYPCIKCNVSTGTGDRIYRLPFDQQYDSTLITPSRGEFYAKTVANAEAAGFRRAFRWRGPAGI